MMERSTRVMGPIVRLMFIQGLWCDDIESSSTDFYLQYFGPRTAELLANNPRLKVAFKIFRVTYLWTMIVYLMLHVFIFCPAGIYTRVTTNVSTRDVACVLLMYTFVLSGIVSIAMVKRNIKGTVNMLDEISSSGHRMNEDYQGTLDNLKYFCDAIMYHVEITFLPFISFATIIYNFVELIPNRKLYFSVWYPFDQTASPYYELVLLVSSVLHVMLALALVTLSSFIFFVAFYLFVHFNVLSNAYKNIRRDAIRAIRERRARQQTNG